MRHSLKVPRIRDAAKENSTRQGYPEERRLTALQDSLLLGTVIIDPIRHRIQNITRYATEPYLRGRRIIDIDRSSPS